MSCDWESVTKEVVIPESWYAICDECGREVRLYSTVFGRTEKPSMPFGWKHINYKDYCFDCWNKLYACTTPKEVSE